jgi:hypothetical protein
MGTEAQAAEFFASHGMADVPRIGDASCQLYRAFGLERGRLASLMGPAVWARGAASILRGHGVGIPIGDPRQMPGVFLVKDGEIVRAFRHETSADVPDYEDLAVCPL